MREGTFREEHEIELSEDDRNTRARQAARLHVALEKHEERAKEAKRKLAEEGKKIEDGLREASVAAETGREKRMVNCSERLVGSVVQTVRGDTGEVVSYRAATKQELDDVPILVPN